MVEPGLHRPGADPEVHRDLVDSQVAVIAQRDHDSVIGPKPGERAAQRIAVVGLSVDISPAALQCGRQVLSPPACDATNAVSARVDQDSVEPVLERCRVAQRPPLAPCLDKGVVGGVLGLGPVADDRPREPIGGVEVLIRQAAEGRGTRRRLVADLRQLLVGHCPGPSAHHNRTLVQRAG